MCLFVKKLQSLSAAEDFFNTLGVPYDPAVLQVKRLHILKRFQHYLHASGADAGDGTFPGADDSEAGIRTLYRTALEAAYRDFVSSDALTERVFKVLRDAVPKAAFVPLTAIERFR